MDLLLHLYLDARPGVSREGVSDEVVEGMAGYLLLQSDPV
uniref:Transcriptional regulator, TetR family n=1 Tax=Nonomuraea gerenzanensis TaxID=93944 RepID=A0A1M4E631_9ACTN|nr:hypothetical protein BN4615_P3769 [Nonomuraea gerenzanensis]